MLGGGRLALAKGALLQLIQRAYEQRAEVAIVAFAGAGAQVRLYPTAARPSTSHALNAWLQPLHGGGATPFAQGVAVANTLLTETARRNPAQQRWLWLFGDGRSEEQPAAPMAADVVTVVDCEQQRIRLGRCRVLAQRWRAVYMPIEELVFS